MDNNRSFLRHEILNIITLMNFLVMDATLSAEEKKQYLEHLKMIQLLCGEQEFILGKSKQYFNQTFDLNEVLEILRHILEARSQKNNVWLTLAQDEMLVKADKNILKNGLEQILLALIDISDEVHLKVNEKSHRIEIEYRSKTILKSKTGPMMTFLKKEHTYAETFLKLAVDLMVNAGIKVDFKKNLVTLKFKKS